jgi:hypothetical protein
MHQTAFLVLAILLATPAACQPLDPERAFAEDMLKRFRSAIPDGRLEIKSDEPLVINIEQAAGWDEASINLHRVYGFCQNASRADCEALKNEFVGKISKNSKPERESAGALKIIVRDQEYVSYVRSTFKDQTHIVPIRVIGEGLSAILAFDSPDTISLATKEGLANVGLSEEQAWDLAMKQTKANLPAIPRDKLVKGEPVAFQDFEYLASLLADTAQWSEISRQGKSDMFVTAVSDNFVMVGFMPDGPKMNQFKQTVAEDCRAQPRCISPFVYRFSGGRWVIAN